MLMPLPLLPMEPAIHPATEAATPN